MITTSIKYVLDLIEREQIKYFIITGADGKSVVLKQDDENASVTDAYNALEDFLSQCEPGIINIKLSNKSFREKGAGGDIKANNWVFRVRVGTADAKRAGTDNNVMHGEVKALMNENYMLRVEIMQMKQQAAHDEKMRSLEAKIEGLKDSDPMEKYAPLIQMLAGKFIPGAAAVHGIAGHEEETKTDDKKTRITKAVNRLLKVDPDFASNLELLADFAEKSPDKYKSFVPMLKVM